MKLSGFKSSRHRGARSIWSKINREKAQALIDSGRMKPAGLRAVQRAKQNGQWQTAYDAQKSIDVPPDLQEELDKHPAARTFFAELNSINRYAILHRIQTAKKPETRANEFGSSSRCLRSARRSIRRSLEI